MGIEENTHPNLNEQQNQMKISEIRPHSDNYRDRFSADWAAVQSNFIDESGHTIVDADRQVRYATRR
jgi:hypothetical protein